MKVGALVAWNLRRLRVQRGRSQEDLAVDAGIDRTYVSRIERGIENSTIGVLEQIAEALDSHIGAFFVEPAAGGSPPEPLPGGRRKSR
jgi:transcriptional regulator with XRE-family HTH domain